MSGGMGEPGAGGAQTGQAPRTITPCNFRSAGRLSNESARTLKHLHEQLARNLMNSLDVYLGNALEAKMTNLEQFTIDEYRVRPTTAQYVVPCTVNPGSHTVLVATDVRMLFTIIDILLGGPGTEITEDRELTEIDEELIRGLMELIVQQIEKTWSAIEVKLAIGDSIKQAVVHKIFSSTEKVLVISFEISVGGITGSFQLTVPAAVGGNLVRNVKTDPTSVKEPVRFSPRLPLETRMLDCKFTLHGGLPRVRVPVRELAALAVGSIFPLGTAIDAAGLLSLEGRPFFDASPVRRGRKKAVELIVPVVEKPGQATDYLEAKETR